VHAVTTHLTFSRQANLLVKRDLISGITPVWVVWVPHMEISGNTSSKFLYRSDA